MNRLLRKIKYFFDPQLHPYKIPATIFAFIATICYLSYFIYGCISGGINYIGNPLNLLNILFYVIVLGCLFFFNWRDDSRAYQGFACFVFSVAINALIAAIEQGIFSFSGFNPSSVTSWLNILWILVFIGVMISGIYLYLLSSRYIRRQYYKWNVVRNVCLVFVVLVVAINAFTIAIYTYELETITLTTWMMIIPAIGEICIALCCFFTLLRYKGF